MLPRALAAVSGWLLIVISSSLSEAPWIPRDVPVEVPETPQLFDRSGPEVTCTAGAYRAQRKEGSQSFTPRETHLAEVESS